MPFDALFLSAVTAELRAAEGARIDRVQQPARDTVLLSVRSRECSRKLLITVNPNHPRVQFTDLSFENPAQPPMFCMLLRKHLVGARIESFTQKPMERLLDITLDCLDELGTPSKKHLMLELMGRTSNLILTGPDGRIIDCLRRVDLEMSEERQVLPGLFYREPPERGKRNPFDLAEEDFFAMLSRVDTPTRLDKFLLDALNGLSPLLCRELAFRITGETDGDILAIEDRRAAAQQLQSFFASFASVPTMLSDESAPREFSCTDIRQYGDYLSKGNPASCSALLDAFYGKRERSERQRQRAQQLTKTVTNHRDRTARKLELQKKERAESQDRERLRRCGDLVTANLYAIKKGQTVLITQDYYDPDLNEIKIPLSPQLSPQQNAAKYYKDYAKAKNAEKILTEQIEKGTNNLAYLNSVLEELSRAETDRDLTEIRAELVEQGYVRETDRKKRMKQQPSKPMEFVSSSGWPILVGRNNRQNDLLTMKTAHKNDIWLHAQKIHGSHVIIVCGGTQPDDETMTEAAQLAAWYSQAREGVNVPVDTTQVRNVKKPPGSLPGMVIYDHYTTLFVTPDEHLPEKLSGNN
ncbi:MAG: NFACT family protein [Oscillospiraceae bacterium]|nr:NFACT family protein [Oscillospiraceae bacterium]